MTPGSRHFCIEAFRQRLCSCLFGCMKVCLCLLYDVTATIAERWSTDKGRRHHVWCRSEPRFLNCELVQRRLLSLAPALLSVHDVAEATIKDETVNFGFVFIETIFSNLRPPRCRHPTPRCLRAVGCRETKARPPPR